MDTRDLGGTCVRPRGRLGSHCQFGIFDAGGAFLGLACSGGMLGLVGL